MQHECRIVIVKQKGRQGTSYNNLTGSLQSGIRSRETNLHKQQATRQHSRTCLRQSFHWMAVELTCTSLPFLQPAQHEQIMILPSCRAEASGVQCRLGPLQDTHLQRDSIWAYRYETSKHARITVCSVPLCAFHDAWCLPFHTSFALDLDLMFAFERATVEISHECKQRDFPNLNGCFCTETIFQKHRWD